MPISAYIKGLRNHIGHAPLLTPGADALVYDADGSLLLMRRRDDGLWGIPGGQLDPLEPPARGVVREVLEETGLVVRPVALLGVFGGVDAFHMRYPNGDELDPIVSLFRCEIVSGELRPLDSEALELRFFPPDALPSTLTPITRYLLEQVAQARSFAWDETWLTDVSETSSEANL